MTRRVAGPLLAAIVCAPLVAQKLPLVDGRTLQLIDLAPLRAAAAPLEPAPAAELAALLRALVEPALEQGQDIRVLGDRLAVLGSPPQVAWVEAFVQRLVAAPTAQVDVTTQVLRVDRQLADELLAPFLAAGDVALAAGAADVAAVRTTDRAAARELLEALLARGVEVQGAPRLLVYNGLQATMQLGRPVRYTRALRPDPDAADAGRAPAVPVPGELFDGIDCRIQPCLLGRDRIGLRLQLRRCEVAEPLPELAVTLPGGARGTIQVPQTRTAELAGVLRLTRADTAVAAAVGPDGAVLVAFVRAEPR